MSRTLKGIDGCRGGWVVSEFDQGEWIIEIVDNLDDIDFDEALIDMPVGIPRDNTRECDRLARKFLAPERHHSIFNCPVKEAVYAQNYEEACDINEELTGKRISRQSWNICSKISEINESRNLENLKESHPELVFKKIDSESIINSKKSNNGLSDRLEVLSRFGDVSGVKHEEFASLSKHDIIDSMVLALAATLDLEKMPKDPEKGCNGKEMCIFFPTS